MAGRLLNLLDVLCLGKRAIVNGVVAYSDQFDDPPRVSGNVLSGCYCVSQIW